MTRFLIGTRIPKETKMPVTLEEIQKQYPTALRAPLVGCTRCQGSGKRLFRQRHIACICIFVEHAHCDWVAKTIADTAKKVAKEEGL